MSDDMLTECGEFECDGAAYTLTAEASRRWGAYLQPGVDSPEMHHFRNALRAALRAEATERDLVIEVFARGAPIDAPDWQVDTVRPGEATILRGGR